MWKYIKRGIGGLGCATLDASRDIASNLFEKYWVKGNSLEGFLKIVFNIELLLSRFVQGLKLFLYKT